MSHDEIAELLGEQSVRAVEGVLYRWRQGEKRKTGKPAGEVNEK